MADSDLTPTTSHTGLYVAGAILLSIGWLASTRLIDEPMESRAEKRLRARYNPRGSVSGSAVSGWWKKSVSPWLFVATVLPGVPP